MQGERGHISYENWKAALLGKSQQCGHEIPLFTDSRIIGSIQDGYGPYQFFNTIPLYPEYQVAQPAIVLRYYDYIEYGGSEIVEMLQKNKTDDERYHGGGLADELAALISLSMGIRIKPGGASRNFQPHDDPRGTPVALEKHLDPALPQGTNGRLLPYAFGPHNINEKLVILQSFPKLSPHNAVALVRTARIYQDALWIIESTPELSWIMLVSAVESAANQWRSEKESPVERLRTSRPELGELLIQRGGESLLSEVAVLVADYMGATRKFIDFVLEFKPDPPQHRPPTWLQFSWSEENLQSSMRKVYQYRSNALHGGIPFPAPMCEPPMLHSETKTYGEVPYGEGVGAMGGVWTKNDLPLLIHTFEYIARNALIAWWKSMTPSE